MGNIEEHITEERARLEAEGAELDALEELSTRFTKLSKTSEHHWGEMLVSPEVNEVANKVYFVNGCSSCSRDAPLEARPLVEVEVGERIFSEKAYVVGEPYCGGYGYTPTPGWKEAMLADSVSTIAIEQVEQFLKDNPPEDCDDDF